MAERITKERLKQFFGGCLGKGQYLWLVGFDSWIQTMSDEETIVDGWMSSYGSVKSNDGFHASNVAMLLTDQCLYVAGGTPFGFSTLPSYKNFQLTDITGLSVNSVQIVFKIMNTTYVIGGFSGLVEKINSTLRQTIDEANKKLNSPVSSLSQADEIKKFKDLLDSGIISQEEFDAKKKQLLDL